MGMDKLKSDVHIALAKQRERQTICGAEGWYFRTRERIDVGPFPTSTDAIAASARLTELLACATAPSQARRVILGFRTLLEPHS